MKRFEPDAKYIGSGDYVGRMIEEDSGDYVLFSDHAAALRAAFARGAEAMRAKYVAAFAHVPQVTVETLPLPEYRDE